jgi:membrane protease YdiL (CAAX protease family)
VISPREFEVVGSLLVVILAVLVHQYPMSVERFQREIGDRDGEYSVLAHRAMGFVLFGLLPFLFSWPLGGVGVGPRGFGTENLGAGLLAAIVIGILSVMVVSFGPVSARMRRDYPVIRRGQWSQLTHWSSNISWIVYILGYEYMYRGFLLFLLADAFGSILAVAFTTALYVLHHLPKGYEEAFSSILMGVVLGALAIWSGGFWAAFMLHAFVAISSEYHILKTHPVIRA